MRVVFSPEAAQSELGHEYGARGGVTIRRVLLKETRHYVTIGSFLVQYAYRTPDGVARAGHQTLRKSRLARLGAFPESGAPVWIVFDPARPARSTIVQFPGRSS